MPKKNKIKADVIIDDKGTLKKTAKGAHSLDRRIKGAAKASSGASKNFSKMSQGITGGLVPAYATLAASMFAISAVFRALSNAADMRVLVQGQQAFATSTGIAMTSVAKSVQAATEAQISFKEASQATAIGFAAGLNADQLERLAAAANSAAKVLGRDVADAFDRMTRGVIKAEPEVLDELGIILRLDIATEKYARSIGRTAESLTTFEKSQAVLNEVLDQAETKYAAIAEGIDPNAFSRLATSFATVAENLSLIVAGPMEAFAAFIGGNLWIAASVALLVFSSILKGLLPTYAEITIKGKESQDILQTEIEESKDKIRGLKAEMQGMDERAGMATGKAGQIAKASGSTDKRTTAGKLASGQVISAKQAKAEILRIERSKNQKIHNMNKGQTKAYKRELKKIAANTQTTTKKIGSFYHQMTTKAKLKFTEMKNSYKGIMMSMTRITSAASKAMTAAMAAAGWIGMIIMAATMIWKLIKGIYSFFNPKSAQESKLEKMTESATEKLVSLNEEHANIVDHLDDVRESWQHTGEAIQFFANVVSSIPLDSMNDVVDQARKMDIRLNRWNGLRDFRKEIEATEENLKKMGFGFIQIENSRDAVSVKKWLKDVEDLTKLLGQASAAEKVLAESEEKLGKIQKKRVDAALKHEYRDEVNALHEIIGAIQQQILFTGEMDERLKPHQELLNQIVDIEKDLLIVKQKQIQQQIVEMAQFGKMGKFMKANNKIAERKLKIETLQAKLTAMSTKLSIAKAAEEGGGLEKAGLSGAEEKQQEYAEAKLASEIALLDYMNKLDAVTDTFHHRWQVGIYDATYTGLQKGFEDMLLLKGDLGDMIVGLGKGLANAMAKSLSDQMARSLMDLPFLKKLIPDAAKDPEVVKAKKFLDEALAKEITLMDNMKHVWSTATENFSKQIIDVGDDFVGKVRVAMGYSEEAAANLLAEKSALQAIVKDNAMNVRIVDDAIPGGPGDLSGGTYDASIAGTATALKATEKLNAGEVAAAGATIGGGTGIWTGPEGGYLDPEGGDSLLADATLTAQGELLVSDKKASDKADSLMNWIMNMRGATGGSGAGSLLKGLFSNMLWKPFGGAPLAKGGTVKGYQGGGKVPGTYRGKDSVPVMLAPGEFVFTPKQLKGLSGGSTVVNVNMGEGGSTISGQQSDSASAVAFGKAIAGAVNKEIAKQKRIGGTLYTQGPGGW